jgi:hypothetical protein
MKLWAGAMGGILTVLAVLALGGCEERQPSEEVAQDYTPAVDAPPTNLGGRPNSNLLADQAKLAREQAKIAAAGAAGGPAGSGADDASVAEIRDLIGKMVENIKAGQAGEVVKLFNPQDAADLQESLMAMARLPKAAGDLDALVKDKLGVSEVPASLKQATAPADKGWVAMAPAAMKVEAAGDVVTAGDGPGSAMRFKKSGGSWEIQLDAREKKFIAATAEPIKALLQFIDAISNGIKDGEITQNNLDQKMPELIEKIVKPGVEKGKAMMDDLAKETPAPAPATAPATAPAPAPAPASAPAPAPAPPGGPVN